jgi:hypothetical protein
MKYGIIKNFRALKDHEEGNLAEHRESWKTS